MLTQESKIMQVVVAQNVVTMSSFDIAELTGKRHSDVIRDIRTMLAGAEDDADLRHELNQGLTEFKDERGYTSHFLLSKFSAELLAMGYSVVLRGRVLSRLYELESGQLPKTLPEALRLAADLAEQKAIADQKLLEAAPKVQFFDTVVQRANLMNATQVGQKLGLSAIKLNQALTELDVYHAGVKRGRVFKQWFIDKGYGELKQTEQGFPQPLFTPAGEAWVVERLISEGYEARRVA